MRSDSLGSLLFDANPTPMWIFDVETLRFLDVNQAAIAAYGYTRDEFLALTIAQIRPPEDVDALRADVARPKPIGLRGAALWRHRRKDGRILTVEITAQDITFDGRAARLVTARDVGETERLAAEIRAQQRFLEAVVEALPAVVFVKDLEGRFVLVNGPWERGSGISRADAIGRTVSELYPASVATEMERADRITIESGARREDEFVLDGPDGPRTYLISRLPLFNPAGEIEGLVGAALDVTDRKRDEEQRARLGSAVEQSAESIIITDLAGNILYVNPGFEQATGYSKAEVLGRNPRLLKSGEHDAAFYRAMWGTLASGAVWSGRLVSRRKDGTLLHEDATIGPVRDASGRVSSFVAVKRDVTKEIELERRFLQAQKMEAVGRLAGGVAHDFNNLLGVITGYGELARTELPEVDPVRSYVDCMLDAAERAAGLTKQLLAFSRRQVLQPALMDLNRLVRDTEQMLRRVIGEDVTLDTSLADGLGRIRADAGQVGQVLLNLAVNARDAMPSGGRLTIATSDVELRASDVPRHTVVPGPYVMLSVSDTGVGMDEETQSHLFEPFFTTKDVGRGTGLGLSTAYGIVEQSDGYIWCESAAGAGATFRICFPRAAGEPEEVPSARRPAVRSAGSGTVLLVEDDVLLRRLLATVLRSAGFEVLVAQDGAQALALAADTTVPIRLLVTDVIMPGMTGRQVAEKVREGRPGLEILFISGYTSDAIERHGLDEPGISFLGKPFSPDDLLQRVHAILHR